MNWYLKVLKQSFDYKGRARRKEFWMFVLFNTIFVFIIMSLIFLLKYIMNEFDGKNVLVQILGTFNGIFILAMLIPSLALTVRRLHDIGKSGWMILISLIPIIGGIWLLILMFTDSTNQNQYGVNPKEA
jgi:uncharacterized membrane protein YhaH (DUF805 family)